MHGKHYWWSPYTCIYALHEYQFTQANTPSKENEEEEEVEEEEGTRLTSKDTYWLPSIAEINYSFTSLQKELR